VTCIRHNDAATVRDASPSEEPVAKKGEKKECNSSSLRYSAHVNVIRPLAHSARACRVGVETRLTRPLRCHFPLTWAPLSIMHLTGKYRRFAFAFTFTFASHFFTGDTYEKNVLLWLWLEHWLVILNPNGKQVQIGHKIGRRVIKNKTSFKSSRNIKMF